MGEGGPAAKPPRYSGASASKGGVGGCAPGEELRVADDEPRRDTHEVSITLTPMLQEEGTEMHKPIRFNDGRRRRRRRMRRWSEGSLEVQVVKTRHHVPPCLARYEQ